MPKSIPVSAAKKFCEENKCKGVVILAWDGELSHVLSYGDTVESCAEYATCGNTLKRLLGWPESTMREPSRVKKLLNRIKELEGLCAQKG